MKLKVVSVESFASKKTGQIYHNVWVTLPDGGIGCIFSDKEPEGDEVELRLGTDNQKRVSVRIK